MTKLIFVLEGEHQHLECIRHQLDGVIQEVLDDAVDAGRFEEDAVDLHWDWDE